jgi:hypothetical protein
MNTQTQQTQTESALNAADNSPQQMKTIGGILGFVGLWLIFMGFANIEGGSSTRAMLAGTAAATDGDMIRITSNFVDYGTSQLGLGFLALFLGAALAAYGQKKLAPEAPAQAAAALTTTPADDAVLNHNLKVALALIAGLVALVAVGSLL